MSVDNVVRHYRQSQAKELLARLEGNESKPHTLALKPGLKEFIVRIQLTHEHHYNQIHELLEKSDFSRTITTRDGFQRDLPHAMFYRSVAPETGSREVFAAVVLLLEEHAKLHSLRDLNPQILVMDAKDVYLDLDRSKHP